MFDSKRIRTQWDAEKEKWYFSVVDIVEVLTGSSDYQTARKYWNNVFSAGSVGSNRERLASDGQLIMPAGHIVVRVYEGGDRFQVFVLNDRSLDYEVIYRTPVLVSRKLERSVTACMRKILPSPFTKKPKNRKNLHKKKKNLHFGV